MLAKPAPLQLVTLAPLQLAVVAQALFLQQAASPALLVLVAPALFLHLDLDQVSSKTVHELF